MIWVSRCVLPFLAAYRMYSTGHKHHLKAQVQRSKSSLFSCRVKCQECMGSMQEWKKDFRRQFLLFLQLVELTYASNDQHQPTQPAVVTPIMFCAKATEKKKKTLKLVSGYQKVYLLLYSIKHIVIHISLIKVARARVVAWRVPEPLWSNGPRHIGYCRKALVIARMINALEWGQNIGFS